MSWAHVQSTGAAGSGATFAKAYASNITSGSLLVCSVGLYTGGTITITGVADSLGQTWTRIGSMIEVDTSLGNGKFGLCLFYFKNSGAGANTVTATYSSNPTLDYLEISEYSGIDTTAPLDQQTGQAQLSVVGGTDNFTSGNTASTSANNELIYGATLINQAATTNAGTGFTQRDTQTDGAFITVNIEDKNLATAGATASLFSRAGGTQNSGVTLVATFKEPAAGKTPAFLLYESGRYNLRHRQPRIQEEWKRRNSIFVPKHVYDGQLLARAA